MNGERVFNYTIPAGETPSEGVIRTIATLEGCDPTTLDTPLYTVIDPDALDTLFDSAGHPRHDGGGRVVFEYYDYEVIVRRNGTIGVRAPTIHSTETVA